jgi:hypothetical protein
MCGVWTLMALTGALMPALDNSNLEFGTPVRLPAFLQVIMFVVGLGSMVAYGYQALRTTRVSADPPPPGPATFE